MPGLMLGRKVGVRAAVATSLSAVTVLSLPALAVQVSFSGFVLDPWGDPVVGASSGLAPGLLGIGGRGFAVRGFSVYFDTPI